MNVRAFFVALALTLLLANMAGATSLAPAPTLSNMAGAWVGPDDQIAYFRLEFDSNGRGLLVASEDSPEGDVSYFEITSTTIDDYSISFNLKAVGDADPTATLAGEITRDGLGLNWGGVDGDRHWSSPVSLQREDRLLEQLEQVRKASVEFRAGRRK